MPTVAQVQAKFKIIDKCRDLVITEVAGKAMRAPRPFSGCNSKLIHKNSPSEQLPYQVNRRLKLKLQMSDKNVEQPSSRNVFTQKVSSKASKQYRKQLLNYMPATMKFQEEKIIEKEMKNT